MFGIPMGMLSGSNLSRLIILLVDVYGTRAESEVESIATHRLDVIITIQRSKVPQTSGPNGSQPRKGHIIFRRVQSLPTVASRSFPLGFVDPPVTRIAASDSLMGWHCQNGRSTAGTLFWKTDHDPVRIDDPLKTLDLGDKEVGKRRLEIVVGNALYFVHGSVELQYSSLVSAHSFMRRG
ncbi:hypothetical protein BDN67DRAFT_981267 [Paxillus ammoniavirescens]|nr:hypothetical protein BDN67DRAFT_981267 [Paxillus ammoniavirescens]